MLLLLEKRNNWALLKYLGYMDAFREWQGYIDYVRDQF